MVAVLLITAAFAAANLAYLAFNPDSFAFEIAAFALGAGSSSIVAYAVRTITAYHQPSGGTSSILLGVGNVFRYYKFSALELPIGPFLDSLVSYTTPLGIATAPYSVSRPARQPPPTPVTFLSQGVPPTGAYNHTLPPPSFGYSFTPDLSRSLGALIFRNAVCPSDGSSSPNRIISASECRESDAPLVEEELRACDAQLYPLSTQVGYLDDTCRSPHPFSGYKAAAAQCELSGPAVGFGTCLGKNPSFASWTEYDRDRPPFEIAEYTSGYELHLRPTGPEYVDNTRPLPGPRLTLAEAVYLDETFTPLSLLSRRHITPESSHLLGTAILRNNTCLLDDRPVANRAVCDRRDIDIDPFESPAYISIPELYLCPAQLANVDGTWAIRGMPDLCDHGISLNWRIAVLTLVLLFLGTPEEGESLPYTLPLVPTHWILRGGLVGSEEEPMESWTTRTSSLWTTPVYASDKGVQDDVSKIERELAGDSEESLEARIDPLDPADIPLPDDADDDFLPGSTTPGAEELVPHPGDKNTGAVAHRTLYADTPSDMAAFDSNMSLASLHGGISTTCDDHPGAGADVSSDLNISGFTFTFTFDIDGRSLFPPFDHRLCKVSERADAGSENVTLRPCKRRRLAKEPVITMDDPLDRGGSAKTTGGHDSSAVEALPCSDPCDDGAEGPESTNPTLEASRIDLEPASNFSAHTYPPNSNKLGSSRYIPLYRKIFASLYLARRPGPYTVREGGDQAGKDEEILKSGSSDSTVVPSDLDLGEDKPMKRRDGRKARTRRLLRRLRRFGIVPPNASKLDSSGTIPLYRKVFAPPSLARRSGLYTVHEEGDQVGEDEEISKSA
ncbi:hypothetical protein FRC10_007776 [Ceratobasidium sp. 414]|nr:hypothetical protein FRC10_007776 [Ceratobasidium sp. 414]